MQNEKFQDGNKHQKYEPRNKKQFKITICLFLITATKILLNR